MAWKYTISGRHRFYNARNTLFLAVAGLHGPEIQYFWPPQILQRPKYIISGCRRLAWPRNTLFLAVADFTMPEIHYFWLLQACMASKYTISGCRRFYNARNTLFLAAAGLHGLEIHYFWPSQVCMAPKYSISGCRKFAWPRNTVFPSDGVVRRYSLFRVAPFGQVRLRPRVGVEQVFASHEAITIQVDLPGGADAVFGEAGGDLAA